MTSVEEIKRKRTARPPNLGGEVNIGQQLRDQEDEFDAMNEQDCVRKAEETRVDIDGDQLPPVGDDIEIALKIGVGVITGVALYLYITADM